MQVLPLTLDPLVTHTRMLRSATRWSTAFRPAPLWAPPLRPGRALGPCSKPTRGGRGWPLSLIHPLVACSFDRTPPLSPSPPHTHTASTATLPEPLPPSATGRVLDSETIFDSAERFRFEVGFRVQGLRGVRV